MDEQGGEKEGEREGKRGGGRGRKREESWWVKREGERGCTSSVHMSIPCNGAINIGHYDLVSVVPEIQCALGLSGTLHRLPWQHEMISTQKKSWKMEDRQLTHLKLGCDREDKFIGAWLQGKTGLQSDSE